MEDFLYIRDLYSVVARDIENLPAILEMNKSAVKSPKTSDFFKNDLSPIYEGRRCIVEETDYEHHNVTLLTELTKVGIKVDDKGLKVYATAKDTGRELEAYELNDKMLPRSRLNELLRQPRKKPKGTYHNLSEPIELDPKYLRSRLSVINDHVYLLEDFQKSK
jgi:hypothetical protein